MTNIFRETIISALESCKAREHKMSIISDMEHEKVFCCEDCNSTVIIREGNVVRGTATKFICSPKIAELSYYKETDEKEVERFIN